MSRSIDFGRQSADYARLRPGFPSSFYDRLERVCSLQGKALLDVGTGPGVLALELARRGANVVGIDVAANQIEAARRRAEEEGLADRCVFQLGRAEATGLAADSYDLVTAGQCWHWFDQAAAFAELRRVLRDRGLLVIAHFNYLPRESDLARQTEALILEMNPTWGMEGITGVHPEQILALRGGGFSLVEQFCYDVDQPFTHEAWRGRIRTCSGVGSGAMSDDEVALFDQRLAALMAERFPDPIVYVKHRIWCVVGMKQSAGA